MKRLLTTTTVVVASALFLAGCGGGSGDTETTPEVTKPDPAIGQKEAIGTAIDAAETAVNAVNDSSTDGMVAAADNAITAARTAIEAATNVSDTGAYTTAVDALENQLKAAKASRTMVMNDAKNAADMARDAMAKKLHAGLGVTSGSLNSAKITIAAAGVMGDVNGDDTADVPFKKTDTMVVGYGSWKGTDHVVKTSSMTDHAVVYSNQDPGKKVDFADKWGSADGVGVKDIINVSGKIEEVNLAAEYVAGDRFASGSGGIDHTEKANDNVQVSGMFDGAPGTYECDHDASACRSQVDGDGGIILSGGWTFEPASGAMVSTEPSSDYVAYGWWSRETSSDVDVKPFQMAVGETDATVSEIETVTGTATYTGGAAGKYSIYNPLDSADSDSGAFTAASTLTAKFGNGTDRGTVSGELNNFMAGGSSRDWTVTLKGAGDEAGGTISATGAIAYDGDPTGQTVWSIDGNEANAGGSWSGNFYNAGDGPGDAPMNAAGTFNSVYGDGVGRMSGAFGATKQ